jgi:agmatine deiminase
MAWPHMRSVWSRHCQPARWAIIDLIYVITRYQKVELLVKAEDLFSTRHCLPVEWDVIPVCTLYNDIWVRDTGPTFLLGGGVNDGSIVHQGSLLALRWTFNKWGWKIGRVGKDCVVGGQIACLSDGGRAAVVIRCPQVLQGGSFHTDGNGRFITMEECLLHPNRASIADAGGDGYGDDKDGIAFIPRVGNGGGGGRSKEEMTLVFEKYLNAKKMIWLLYGVDGDNDINGHMDNLIAFMTSCGIWQSWTRRTPMMMNTHHPAQTHIANVLV